MNLELAGFDQPSETRLFEKGGSTATASACDLGSGDLGAGLALVQAHRPHRRVSRLWLESMRTVGQSPVASGALTAPPRVLSQRGR